MTRGRWRQPFNGAGQPGGLLTAGQAFLHSGTRGEHQYDKWKKSHVQESSYLRGESDKPQPWPPS